ncbi:MAG: peroxide stress protein YaaA [Tabrizicola sp.]|uniref:peroxide stress protein YaaA n=1 Tax=Tabrizicola sp. TaxID=2005166 RepID=UPI00273542CD|nr:peroxide stress protein YaaA [Tabrizicola sp.]MDP3264774.1 peroxide stress protein YaaA [Tabrizicola sp.]MDP3647509.1 peroxide stress protein YaaA [Paracoccaceae bacterium]MDZ4067011.1 peroxide stress protein YaaA [Tabrizicola sp.]
MLCVISPAKKLNETPRVVRDEVLSEPDFAAEAMRLVSVARDLSVADLQGLMSLSEPLARLNRDRFRAYRRKPAQGAAFPAIHCFAGDTYQGLDAATLSGDAMSRAGTHLRILSGLYGLLKPLDAIQPYRLEMGSRLANARGPDLYAFWGDKIAKALNVAGRQAGTAVLLNCASVEYFRAADRKALKLRVISPVFLDGPAGGEKVISFFAKRARGAMARFVMEHRLTDPADVRGFDGGGYRWRAEGSTPEAPVFLREAAAEDAA